MLALANFAEANDHKASNDFTIVTADAAGGTVDVHDRRPVVLSAEDAAVWMDPATPDDVAEQLARSVALCPSVFE